ncbi:MAG: hypothetical protein LBL26_04105 [Peptococcaceae bacterium]|nr:hypothetical protein [Peptococcaceae bacterium]
MSQPIMPVPEQAETVRQANKLREAGQTKEADALERTIPLPAYLAKVLKEKVGADFL